MDWIYPEQLYSELKKHTKFVYILLGNDFGLLEDSRLIIFNLVNASHKFNRINILVDINYNWNNIFYIFKTIDIFSKYKILSLKFSLNYPVSQLYNRMSTLTSLINKDLILIISIHTSRPIITHKIWLQLFYKTAIFVNCIHPKNQHWKIWIHNQSKHMKLNIDNKTCQLLCYYYEGNTIALKQILQQLSTIYPDGNINVTKVQNMITDNALFNFNHWIEAILTGNKHRAYRILRQLNYKNDDLKILLNKIQHEILILIQIKYGMIIKKSLENLLQKYKIHTQYHRMILTRAIQQFTFQQLSQGVSFLIQIERHYNHNYEYISKLHLKLFIEILYCKCKIPLNFTFTI